MSPATPEALTPREAQILCGMVRGGAQEHVGALMSPPLARATVSTHLLSVRRKLRARNTAHAVLLACQQGWLPVSEDICGPPVLSQTQRQLINMVARGHAVKEAARQTGYDKRAVQYQLERAYAVLGATNRVHAVYLAIASGDVPLAAAGPDAIPPAAKVLTDTAPAATVRTGARRFVRSTA